MCVLNNKEMRYATDNKIVGFFLQLKLRFRVTCHFLETEKVNRDLTIDKQSVFFGCGRFQREVIRELINILVSLG